LFHELPDIDDDDDDVDEDFPPENIEDEAPCFDDILTDFVLPAEDSATTYLSGGATGATRPGLPDLIWHNIPKLENIPNGYKIYPTEVKYTK
jgi:hypothetical protein